MAPVSVVVIPARDEQDAIGASLAALARQTVGTDAFPPIEDAPGSYVRVRA